MPFPKVIFVLELFALPYTLVAFGKNSFLQFERYTSLSTFNSSHYYNRASRCEYDPRERSINLCAEYLAYTTKLADPSTGLPHWDRIEGNVSCAYSVRFHQWTPPLGGDGSHLPTRKQKYFHFKVQASDCRASYGKSKGGASFDAVAVGPDLDTCRVVDNWDDSYDIYCRAHNANADAFQSSDLRESPSPPASSAVAAPVASDLGRRCLHERFHCVGFRVFRCVFRNGVIF
jgi:hypothetical protein